MFTLWKKFVLLTTAQHSHSTLLGHKSPCVMYVINVPGSNNTTKKSSKVSFSILILHTVHATLILHVLFIL